MCLKCHYSLLMYYFTEFEGFGVFGLFEGVRHFYILKRYQLIIDKSCLEGLDSLKVLKGCVPIESLWKVWIVWTV